MDRRTLASCALLLAAALGLAGCSRQAVVEPEQPAAVTPIKGTTLNQITLTEIAYRNLGIKTEAVRSEGATAGIPAGTRLVIPTSALVFDSKGDPYAYTSPSARTYVRAPLAIAGYLGTDVILTSGPPAGTLVVIVGDPELLGIEYGVGAE